MLRSDPLPCAIAGGEGDGQREEDPAAAVCHGNLSPACWGVCRAHWCVFLGPPGALAGVRTVRGEGRAHLPGSWGALVVAVLVGWEGPSMLTQSALALDDREQWTPEVLH